jgi:hypothetical protein
MVPHAIVKAESLLRHVKQVGAPQREFAISLTKGEAYELLDYIQDGQLGHVSNQQLLEADIAEAKERCDPFLVLRYWQLLGFELVPAESLH